MNTVLRSLWFAHQDEALSSLVPRAYAFALQEGLSRTEAIEEILTLAGDQWRVAKSYIPVLQYAPDDAYYGCQTDDYGTVIDPISLSEIPLERLP